MGSQKWFLEPPQEKVHHDLLMELAVSLAMASGTPWSVCHSHCVIGEVFVRFPLGEMTALTALEETLPEGA